MTLGEALTRRADLAKLISETNIRLQQSLYREVLAKDNTPVDPSAPNGTELLMQLDRLQEELMDLIVKINITNSRTNLHGEEDITITRALAKRDMLAALSGQYNNLAKQVTSRQRYITSDTFQHQLDGKTLVELARARKEGIDTSVIEQEYEAKRTKQELAISYNEAINKANQFSKQHRELDLLIQETNWTTPLL